MSCINNAYLCKFYKTLAHKDFHSGIMNSVKKLIIDRDHILWVQAPLAWLLAAIFLAAWTQIRHGCNQKITAGRHPRTDALGNWAAWQVSLQQQHSKSTLLNYSWHCCGLGQTALTNNVWPRFFWRLTQAKDHFQYNSGCSYLFWEVEVYLCGPEKDSWLVETWPHRPSHTFLWE